MNYLLYEIFIHAEFYFFLMRCQLLILQQTFVIFEAHHSLLNLVTSTLLITFWGRMK